MMNIGLQNVFTDELNGLLFSIMGMLIVFVGLVFICSYIVILPHILEFLKKRRNEIRDRSRRQKVKAKAHHKAPNVRMSTDDQDDIEDVMVAIATALHLEHSFLGDNQKYTWKDELTNGHWQITGRMKQSINNMKAGWR